MIGGYYGYRQPQLYRNLQARQNKRILGRSVRNRQENGAVGLRLWVPSREQRRQRRRYGRPMAEW